MDYGSFKVSVCLEFGKIYNPALCNIGLGLYTYDILLLVGIISLSTVVGIGCSYTISSFGVAFVKSYTWLLDLNLENLFICFHF